MLEKPDISDDTLIAHLRENFDIDTPQVDFLPLGADVNTAVYRVTTGSGAPYFLKLRGGVFEAMSILIPRFLRDQGVRQIIEPLRGADGEPWSHIDGYTTVLYPFVEGRNAWESPLTDAQWVAFGAALRQIQSIPLPPDLRGRVPVETYSAKYREQVKEFLSHVERQSFTDPTAARMAKYMRQRHEEIAYVTARAESLARELIAQPLPPVLCHADLHAGNLLVTAAGDFYIVDWDNPILAPKERDLMFIGAGIGDNWNTAREESLFYQGYGSTTINDSAMAYYRFERIVQDFAAYCEEILLSLGNEEDRKRGLRFFMSNFDPGGTIEIARRTDAAA